MRGRGFRFYSENIRVFVTDLGVSVVSCFEVQPRRRRPEKDIGDRKAFRLCICADDSERLLDADKWPESVIISEWFFKPQQRRESPLDKRLRVANQNEGDKSKNDCSGNDVVSGLMEHEVSVSDETIIMNLNSTTSSTDDHGSKH